MGETLPVKVTLIIEFIHRDDDWDMSPELEDALDSALGYWESKILVEDEWQWGEDS